MVHCTIDLHSVVHILIIKMMFILNRAIKFNHSGKKLLLRNLHILLNIKIFIKSTTFYHFKLKIWMRFVNISYKYTLCRISSLKHSPILWNSCYAHLSNFVNLLICNIFILWGNILKIAIEVENIGNSKILFLILQIFYVRKTL